MSPTPATASSAPDRAAAWPRSTVASSRPRPGCARRACGWRPSSPRVGGHPRRARAGGGGARGPLLRRQRALGVRGRSGPRGRDARRRPARDPVLVLHAAAGQGRGVRQRPGRQGPGDADGPDAPLACPSHRGPTTPPMRSRWRSAIRTGVRSRRPLPARHLWRPVRSPPGCADDRACPGRGSPCGGPITSSSTSNGVGYRLAVSAETLSKGPRGGQGRDAPHPPDRARDDALQLYGFASEEERELFLLLLTVQLVGPKMALGVLSGGPPRESDPGAVAAGDTARFQAVPGIGKRTAERIVVELRTKVEKKTTTRSSSPAATTRARSRATGSFELGFAAASRPKKLCGATGDSVEELIGEALRGARKKRGRPPASRRRTGWPDEDEFEVTLRPRRLEEFVGQEAVREQLGVSHRGRAQGGRAARAPAPGRFAGPRQDHPRPHSRQRARGPDRPDGRVRPSSARATSRAADRPRTAASSSSTSSTACRGRSRRPCIPRWRTANCRHRRPGRRRPRVTLDLPPFTLVGATTREGLLSTPFRDRFGLPAPARPLRGRGLRIVIARRDCSAWTSTPAAPGIASRTRGTPRVANRLLRRVRDFAQVHEGGVVAGWPTTPSTSSRSTPRASIDRPEILSSLERSAAGPSACRRSRSRSARSRTRSRTCTSRTSSRAASSRTPRGRVATAARLPGPLGLEPHNAPLDGVLTPSIKPFPSRWLICSLPELRQADDRVPTATRASVAQAKGCSKLRFRLPLRTA